ncbi:MAG: N-acetylmuramoyl-L-alanine amidase [Xanthomonadales bacterium]|nr:N-acetylmuramoyl-L-alanine amidase [Xanthomonadales bacterium]
MNVSDISNHPLPYIDRLERREPEVIDLVVVHCTELPDLETAREYGKRVMYPETATGNSGHFYIERSGRIEQWVPVERVAHHVRGHNEHSIGIELVNRGRHPDWFHSRQQAMSEPYPLAQLNSLIGLVLLLKRELPGLKRISGHENLDRSLVPATDDPKLLVYRKKDPGPLFPWKELLPVVGLEMFTG